jgi:hypothetical protein
MSASSPRPTSRRHLAWLLWFGMLFAFAQGVASAHAISHIGQDAGRTRDGGLVHAQCDLCLIGATIAGAAPLPDAPPALPLVRAEVPRDATTPSAPSNRPERPYQSRAPPLASR